MYLLSQAETDSHLSVYLTWKLAYAVGILRALVPNWYCRQNVRFHSRLVLTVSHGSCVMTLTQLGLSQTGTVLIKSICCYGSDLRFKSLVLHVSLSLFFFFFLLFFSFSLSLFFLFLSLFFYFIFYIFFLSFFFLLLFCLGFCCCCCFVLLLLVCLLFISFWRGGALCVCVWVGGGGGGRGRYLGLGLKVERWFGQV